MISRAVAALCAVAAGAPALAQEWSANLGGFMTTGIGYVDADRHNAGVEIVNDAEVIFNFRLVADNGVTFGAKVEFEANGRRENADEYVATIAGAFGAIEIGREDGAGDRLRLTPPGCGFSCSGDADGFLFDHAASEAGDVIENEGRDTGDDLKVTYFSPRVSGFRVGASYTPGQGGNGATSTVGANQVNGGNGDNRREGFELGARWDIALSETMGTPDAALALSGSYFSVKPSDPDDSYALAAEFDAFGFGVGGRFTHLEDGPGEEQNASIGVEYGTGPWYFGVNVTFILDSDLRDDGDTAAGAEVNYALAPGVTLAGILEYADYDFGPAATDPDGGFAAGVLLGLDF